MAQVFSLLIDAQGTVGRQFLPRDIKMLAGPSGREFFFFSSDLFAETSDIDIESDLFSRVLFSFFPPLVATPLPPLFSGPFSPFSPPRNVIRSVEQRAQLRAWRRAVSGRTSPEGSGRKFLPDICVKKGQESRSIRLRDRAETEGRRHRANGVGRGGVKQLLTRF